MEKNKILKRSLAALLFFAMMLCLVSTALADDQTVSLTREDTVKQIEEQFQRPITTAHERDAAVFNKRGEYFSPDMPKPDFRNDRKFLLDEAIRPTDSTQHAEYARAVTPSTRDKFSLSGQLAPELDHYDKRGSLQIESYDAPSSKSYEPYMPQRENHDFFDKDRPAKEDNHFFDKDRHAKEDDHGAAGFTAIFAEDYILEEQRAALNAGTYLEEFPDAGTYLEEFPDANFRSEVLSFLNNVDGGSRTDSSIVTEIDLAMLAAITDLYIEDMDISNMTGLAYFTGLRYLNCWGNKLTTLDMSNSPALEYLDCWANQLISLDVSKNTMLEYLSCDDNFLTALDVSKNTRLKYLYCDSNKLTALDVSKNTALEWLDCRLNQLTELDVSNNTVLEMLNIGSNELILLDVSKNTTLTQLYCYNNQLANLDVSHNTALQVLSCWSNQLSALDVTKNVALEALYCDNNELITLDVSKNIDILSLTCRVNYIQTTAAVIGWQDIGLVLDDTFQFYPQKSDIEFGTYLKEFPDANFRREVLRLLNDWDGSKNRTEPELMNWNDYFILASISELYVWDMGIADMTGLKYFSGVRYLACGLNQLTNLDVSNNTELEILNVGINNLISLDVSKNKTLKYLFCFNNQLTNLDVSYNTELLELDCWSNQLSSLDVSKNTELGVLFCSDNELTDLDVSKNTMLLLLDCRVNYMESTDDVTNWQANGLILNDSFLFYPQKPDIVFSTFLKEFPDANFRNEVLWQLNDSYNIGRTDESIMSWTDIIILESTTELDLENKGITDLAGLKYFSGLTYLRCDLNQLTELDISQNTKLQTLYCCDNQLITLDVSKNTSLGWLNCSDNQLTMLDVSKNTELNLFACSNNQLTTLDISQNAMLEALDCSNNHLTTLDVSNNSALEWLSCCNNFMTSPSDVKGWQQLGLVINSLEDPESGTFYFYPQSDPPKPLITITTQPAATTTVTEGSISGNLSVTATATPQAELKYQWYSNTTNSNTGGAAINGATAATFTIPKTLTAGTYYYYCVVSATDAESVTSNVAAVTVAAGGSPPISGGGGGGVASNDATLSITKADFDLNDGKDISVSLTLNSRALNDLKNGAYTLKIGTDYTLNNRTVTIKASYLATLSVGTQTINFVMNGGKNPQLVITVKDTSLVEEPEITLAAQPGSFSPFIQGFENNTFRGDSPITREQFVAILYRLNNAQPLPTADKNNPSFKDVAPVRWSYDAIEWAKQSGITAADAAGNFRPAEPLTRAEMAVMLVKADNLTQIAENTFSDLDDHPDKNDILKAVEAKIFTGYTDGSFKPEGNSTRAEAVTALIRYLLEGEPTDEMWQGISLDFSDVSRSDWAYKYIALAVKGV